MCLLYWMWRRLCLGDDSRLLTATINTSNEHNSCFPQQLIFVACIVIIWWV